MKIFHKERLDNEFLDAEGEKPEKNEGKIQEGSIIIKIGEQSGRQNIFKLNIDETRKFVDSLKKFIDKHDNEELELINQDNNYGMALDTYPQNKEESTEESTPPILGMFLDAENAQTKEAEKKKEKAEVYYY